MTKMLGVLLVCFILVNLFMGLVNIVRDRSQQHRVVRNFTLRVVFSVALFVVAMLAIYFEQAPS